jgi:hypothetical protein
MVPMRINMEITIVTLDIHEKFGDSIVNKIKRLGVATKLTINSGRKPIPEALNINDMSMVNMRINMEIPIVTLDTI